MNFSTHGGPGTIPPGSWRTTILEWFLCHSSENAKLGQFLLSLKSFREKKQGCNFYCIYLLTQEEYMCFRSCGQWRRLYKLKVCRGTNGAPGVVQCTTDEIVCGNLFLNIEHRKEKIPHDSTSQQQHYYFATFPPSLSSRYIVFLNDIIMYTCSITSFI